MTAFIFADNVNTSLASALSSSATSLTLASTANLPSSIPAGFVLAITLNDQATRQNFEIVYATSISGATLSGLMRGQEGTSAQNWLVGDFAWNGITAGQMQTTSAGRQLGAPTLLTSSSGTFSPNPVSTLRRVQGSSGGGGGGGAVVTNSSQASVGSGGNSGSYVDFWIIGSISGSIAYTCGAAGTGVAGANGNAGGQSTFGSYATLPGGLGGLASTPTSPPFFGSGNGDGPLPTISGTGVVPILSLPSASGGGAFALTLNSNTNSPGRGNNNLLGLAPNAGYGTGGNGVANGASGSAQAGTTGTPGCWIVTEFA